MQPVSDREVGPVTRGFGSIVPFTALGDTRLLDAALDARARRPDLVALDMAGLTRWVVEMKPAALQRVEHCDVLGDLPTGDSYQQIDYAQLVHNRDDVDALRVARVAHMFLHEPNGRFAFQRGVTVASSAQLGRPA